MYEFAVVTLLGLVALKVTDLVIENVPGLDRIRTLFSFALAIVLALALDYSVFEGFGVSVREAWMGTVGTGLVIGSLASAWTALLGWFGSTSIGDATKTRNERPRIAAYPLTDIATADGASMGRRHRRFLRSMSGT